MQRPGNRERKGWDRGSEYQPIVILQFITSFHGTYGGLDDRSAGVLELFAWRNLWLLSDNALSTDFLGLVPGIPDDPVPIQELYTYSTLITDGDAIGKYETGGVWVRLLGDIGGGDFDFDPVFLGCHA